MTLTMKIWDVKQGLAVYVNTPNGKHITIDAGIGSHEEGEFYPLYHINKNHNVEKIDFAIITHPHKDHIQEIKNLVVLKPKVLLRPKHITKNDLREIRDEDKELFEEYFNFSDKYTSSVSNENDPSLPNNNGGVTIQTFHPINCPKDNLNNHSIVTLISYASSKILIPGDNEPISWSELLEDKDFVAAIKGVDIFIAPHHGRESSYHKELFDHFTPKVVIISDGPATSANASDKYSSIASGWEVFNRSDNNSEKRFCLSTRKDGMIQIKMGQGSDKPFLNVTKL